MILDAAVEFFAEKGFGAQTRELAVRLGISEPLIYRYFPTKEVLVQSVFHEVIESRWNAEWATLLRDRSIPLRTRLVDFYQCYLDTIDDAIWIRIVMYASLDGRDMTRQYISSHVEDVMGIVATELSASLGLDQEVDPEQVWHLQSTLIYYLVRKHIHLTSVTEDRSAIVAMVVGTLLDSPPVLTASASKQRARDRGRPSAGTRGSRVDRGESTS